MVLSIPLWATFWFSPNCQDSSRSLTRICLPTTPNCSPGTEPRNMCWKFTLSWIVQAKVHGTESRTANAQGSLINLAMLWTIPRHSGLYWIFCSCIGCLPRHPTLYTLSLWSLLDSNDHLFHASQLNYLVYLKTCSMLNWSKLFELVERAILPFPEQMATVASSENSL